MNAKQLQLASWGLTVAVLALVVTVWAMLRLDGQPLTTYDIFPVLGLSAFSIMWVHYIAGAARRYFGLGKETLKSYMRWTGWLVLVLILLHPGIFLTQLWLDGLGLPPMSYLDLYTAPLQKTGVLLGSTALLIFLSFELHRFFKGKVWWKFVEYLNMLAMFAIFMHAIFLGGELTVTWFRSIWFFFGITLLAAVVYTIYIDRRKTT